MLKRANLVLSILSESEAQEMEAALAELSGLLDRECNETLGRAPGPGGRFRRERTER